MSRKISFIGIGAISGAVLERLIRADFASASEIFASDVNQARLDEVKREYGVRASTDSSDAVGFGDVIVLGVMPKDGRHLLEEIRDLLSESQVAVSFVGLLTTGVIEEILRSPIGVTRVTPSIPSMVGAGFNVFCFGRYMRSKEIDWVKNFLNVLGEYKEVDEDRMEIYSLLSAMGPAYFLPFLDVLIDFGVENGLSLDEARKAICSTMKGTAELASRIQRPIEDLNNMVRTQPLKAREQELRSIIKEELNKTLRQQAQLKEELAGS